MIPIKLRIIREKNRLYSMFFRIRMKSSKNASRVFLFHDILPAKDDIKTIFAISKKSFERFLLNQLNEGKKALTFKELSEIILKNRKMDNGFFISFDDANTSVYTVAYPFLKKHNIPFIIFITKELIGKSNYLAEEQIKELANDPICTVGSHGVSHRMFRYLSKEETNCEFSESKKYLEELTGTEVNCFAFPYGRIVECSSENIKSLEQSKYNFAFSAIAGTLKDKKLTGQFFLPRINVDESMVM